MITVAREDRLAPSEVAAVLELARSAGDVDGAYPLSEHTVLHLRQGGDLPSVHLVVKSDGQLAGYAHVDTTDQVSGASAELLVGPAFRRRGLGRALVTAALAAAREHDSAGRLRLWAHGDHPSASALALSLGFRRERNLWQMRRSLFADVPEPVWPAGVRVRAFQPGQDERAWLALNARAFADHPEQGRWTERDLRARMAESWFDASGFLLAVRSPQVSEPGSATAADGRGADRDGTALADAGSAGPGQADGPPARVATPDGVEELVGFHWTKVHGDPPGRPDVTRAHQHDPIGEVYVLGVDPAAHGTGLGRALTLAGLRHLRALGLDQVMLYVDEDNSAATRLYLQMGFARWATDVMFAWRPEAG